MTARGLLPRSDDFVHRIVEDPSNPPDTLLLVGFVGSASAADHTRVYLDVLLGSYVEVPNQSILYAREIPDSQSPLGGSYVWVRRDQELVQRVRAARQEMLAVQHEFLADLEGDRSMSNVAPGWPTIPT